jgi:hypothetical protein
MILILYKSVLATRVRPRTARARLVRLINTQNWALRAPRPLLNLPATLMIYREKPREKNPSLGKKSAKVQYSFFRKSKEDNLLNIFSS